MKIQAKDFFHGAALTQIVEHPSFKALNKASDKYGHCLVNKDIRVFVKYSNTDQPWQFTLNPDDSAATRVAAQQPGSTFLALVKVVSHNRFPADLFR